MRITIMAAVAFGLLSARAEAVSTGRGGGWGPEGSYGRSFDPKSVETVEGEILRVEPMPSSRGMSRSIHLVLEAAQEELAVHLGPEWYMKRQDFKMKPGDKMTITGSRTIFDGKPALIASELRKGKAVLRLRDEQGHPAWAGLSRADASRAEAAKHEAAEDKARTVQGGASKGVHACHDDIERWCGKVKPGEGRLGACLKKNAAKLSESCRRWTEHAGPGHVDRAFMEIDEPSPRAPANP